MGEIADLEKLVRREQMEKAAETAVRTARIRLLLAHDARGVFFGTLVMCLDPRPSWDVPTFATDGQVLLYNPEFATQITLDERVGVLCHEVMHVAFGHMSRRGQRDPEMWNTAADLAINPIVRDASYALPKGGLMPGQPPFEELQAGLSAEAYYEILKDMASKGGAMPSGQDPGGCGAVMDAGSPAEQAEVEADWQVAVAQAATMAKGRGELPAGLARAVDEVLEPSVSWREVLREFVSRTARDDYSWTSPNRRFVWRGMYLPGIRSEELGDVVIMVDTSGSIGPQVLDQFAAEAQGVLEAYNCTATVIYHDYDVQGVERWEPTDGPFHLNAKGGGGTSHVPAFQYVDSHDLRPTCVIALTDMESDFPPVPPPYPVLWASVNERSRNCPAYGRLVTIK